MLSILGFLAVLGPLVIFHELGHYLFARLFNVKAEVFSVGFGPTLWKRQMGETELRVSAVPLGGYVRLLGEDGETELAPELKPRTLQAQEPWKRFLIYFAGPLFNFILAIFVFALILVIGQPHMASHVGRVLENSPAEQAGFRTGDRIIAVDGEPVTQYEEVALKINESLNKPIHFQIERTALQSQAPERLELTVAPTGRPGYTVYGEHTQVGEIEGLFPTARSNQLGVSHPESIAGKAGLKTGDQVVSLNQTEIKDWETLEKAYQSLPAGEAFQIGIQPTEGKALTLSWTKPAKAQGMGQDFGLHSTELFVEKAMEDSPAALSGVQKGDRLVSVAGEPIRSFFDLKDQIEERGSKDGKVDLTWERNGQVMTATIAPSIEEKRDVAMKKTLSITVGVVPMLTWAEPKMVIERILNPVTLLFRATEKMVTFSWRNIVSIKKMVTGDVSVGTLGGPILIGKLAGDSLARGLISFLTMLAVLSIGLGVLNTLPIPMLDGGHLTLIAIEQIRGKPLTIRQMEIIQQVGLSLIVLLMVVVMKNDIARLSFFD